MAEPTIQETSRLLDALLRSGTIRRLDMLHQSLCHAYKLGQEDQRQECRAAEEK